ncbi:centrosomal protein of 68 kDa-like, partial [Arapaima gigas]
EVGGSMPVALEADGMLADLTDLMETRGYGRPRRKTPDSVCRSSPVSKPLLQCLVQKVDSSPNLLAKDVEHENFGRKKTVTMAPRSRYLTQGGQYLTRKPLFASESQVSILKRPVQQEPLEEEEDPEGRRAPEHLGEVEESPSSPPREEKLCSSDFLPEDPSTLSATEDDLAPPLTTLDLLTWSYEDSAVARELNDKGSHRRSLSSPPLDHSLTVPLRPKWTSTVRSFSLEPRALSCTPVKRASALHLVSVLGGSAGRCPPSLQHMSPHQANYWACAIPPRLPPCPDRKSPSWDPNKEYLDLLDYTYPLRPNVDPTELPCSSGTSTLLQDSGVELDRFCSSTSPSCLELAPSAIERDSLAERQLKKMQEFKPYSSRQSSRDQTGLSAESLLESNSAQSSHWEPHHKEGISSSSSVFIPTWRVLPSVRAPWDGEDEFHPLPDRLEEMAVLLRDIRTLSLRPGIPAVTSWESLGEEPGGTGTLTEDQPRGESLHVEEVSASEASGSTLGVAASLESLSGEVNRENLRVVATCMEHLRETLLRELQKATKKDQGDGETKESLTHHIQTFSTNLEELIVWLYQLVEKVEGLKPPAMDIESVKSCLASYKSFQREVSTRQNLTAAVLHTGEALLHCMTSTSPVLRDTLALIERQSQALEAHAEQLFSSILSAMDSLTDPRRLAEDCSPQDQNLSETVFLEQD